MYRLCWTWYRVTSHVNINTYHTLKCVSFQIHPKMLVHPFWRNKTRNMAAVIVLICWYAFALCSVDYMQHTVCTLPYVPYTNPKFIKTEISALLFELGRVLVLNEESDEEEERLLFSIFHLVHSEPWMLAGSSNLRMQYFQYQHNFSLSLSRSLAYIEFWSLKYSEIALACDWWTFNFNRMQKLNCVIATFSD